MKILDVFSADEIPETPNRFILATGRQLVGSRFSTYWSFAGSGSPGTSEGFIVASLSDGRKALQMTSYGAYNNGSPYCAVHVPVTDSNIQPDEIDSIITLGVRQTQFSTQGTVPSGTSRELIQIELHASDLLARVPVVSSDDIVVQEHYWEVVVDRKSGEVTVYRDNALYKTVDISSNLADGQSLAGFAVGSWGRVGVLRGYGRLATAITDLYLAEFSDDDLIKRLGPQQVIKLPLASVNAPGWNPTATGVNLLRSLSEKKTTYNTAAHLTVEVPSSPPGEVLFDYSPIGEDDVVNGLFFNVDALAGPGSSSLGVQVYNDENTVSASSFEFSQTSPADAPPKNSNFGRPVFVLSVQNVYPGNVEVLNGHKLKIFADDTVS